MATVKCETPVTLRSIVADPGCATFPVETPTNGILEPLSASHEEALAVFFAGLSPQTRRFYSVTDGASRARENCAAIARYDKLRLILRNKDNDPIVALVEFSFDLTAGDVERFATYGVGLGPETDCRWGLCVADQWQGRGVGTALAPASFEIARRFGREHVILWGGVQAANSTAVRYYRKVGFRETGRFTNDDNIDCVDMIRQLGEPGDYYEA